MLSFLMISLWACQDATKTQDEKLDQRLDSAEELILEEEPDVALPSPSLRRLTISQYNNIIADIFSPSILIPSSLEPDIETNGFFTIGASISTISPVGTERYETASYTIAEQIVSTPDILHNILPCQDINDIDPACIDELLEETGSLLWRRPLSLAEQTKLSNLAQDIANQTDWETALKYLFSALLQSPYFLYRLEEGTNGILSNIEFASRLAFFLWNSAPDETLLSLAEEGTLLNEDVLEQEVERMMADSRFENGIRNFFTELFHLYRLDSLVKDPLVFNHASPELYLAAKEETLLFLLHNVQQENDYRDILTAQETFIDRRLAALYNIAAPTSDGFGAVVLPDSLGRRGLLGQASFLNLEAHATSTSATLRGIFIRKNLLCQEIPPPPAGVNTSIPEADAESPTLRERLQTHLEDPACASCHELTDLVGLGLENFDGIGRWRDYENGSQIDVSGKIDNFIFQDAWELSEAVAEHRNFAPCIAENIYAYATGHAISDEEEDFVDWLSIYLQYSNWSLKELIRGLVLSENFIHTGVRND